MSTGRLWLCARERDGGGWEEAACTSTVRMCTSSEAGHTSDGVSAPGEVLVAACATASDSAKFVQLAAQLAAMYLRHEAGGGGVFFGWGGTSWRQKKDLWEGHVVWRRCSQRGQAWDGR